MPNVLIIFGVFLACAVEAVEALTIVLAVGTTRSWRSAWFGVGAAVAVLGICVAVFGTALAFIPIDVLRLVVGGLLLVFGLQWMRKAILRLSGHKAMHDESTVYNQQVKTSLSIKGKSRNAGLIDDWYSFTVAFKGVLLEGLEVAFIVITFGANQGSITLAVWGALAAIILVIGAGFAVRQPLSRVPENTLKFVVGIMLTSFGIFWAAEGAGVEWPGQDVALLGVISYITVCAFLLVAWLKQASSQQTNIAGKI